MQRLLHWLDEYGVQAGVILLLVLIPLYPKFPLLGINHTWVYIRLEDLAITLVILMWLIQIIRKKLSYKVPLGNLIIIYWSVGLISLLFTLIFLSAGLANFFPAVATLHYLRRIEYMIVFFIAASTINNLAVVKRYIWVCAVVLVGVFIYGFGQRLLGFPAFLTMNEEFAKGQPLYLSATSRLTSTFAGHYDLAAYLVMMIGLFVGIFFGVKKKITKILIFILVFVSYILLLLTASRVSFGVYLLVVCLVLWLQKQKKYIVPVILGSLLVMNFTSGAAQRFAKTFRVQRVVYDAQTGKAIGTVETLPSGDEKIVPEAEEDLPLGNSFIDLSGIGSKAPEATQVAVIKKTPTSLKTATNSSQIATISGEFLIKRALVYDISFTTRFQGTWLRAWNAFMKSPIFGTGYSSIGLASDNSYLRSLGETGLLGFISFVSILGAFALLIKQGLAKIKDEFSRSLLIGVSAGLLGIALNAILIDVFEASKVAYILWLLAGISVGTIYYYLPVRLSLLKEAFEVLKNPIVPILILLTAGVIVYGPELKNYFVGDDFTWLRWADWAKQINILSYFTSTEGFFYRPLTKILFASVYPFLELRPVGYHIIDLILHITTTIGAYLLVLVLFKRRILAFVSAFFFLISPLNGESVLWMSSTSALMGSMFYIWGLVAYFYRRWVGISFMCFILALFSHELTVTFPLILIAIEIFINKKRNIRFYVAMILTLSGYLYLRNKIAGAHWSGGDYSYNLSNLIFNLSGNSFGYFGQLLFGSGFLNIYNNLRGWLRQEKIFALFFIIVGIGGISLLAKKFVHSKIIAFSFIWFGLVLLPYLGLGNIADRHVYPAHLGFYVLVALMIEKVISLKKLYIAGLLFCLITGFYIWQLAQIKEAWYQAGEISNRTLLSLGTNYSDFPTGSTLYFVNLPIQHERAWVFPVGLEDGLWFIYPNSQFKVIRTNDLDQTMTTVAGIPNSFVFDYKDGEITEMNESIK